MPRQASVLVLLLPPPPHWSPLQVPGQAGEEEDDLLAGLNFSHFQMVFENEHLNTRTFQCHEVTTSWGRCHRSCWSYESKALACMLCGGERLAWEDVSALKNLYAKSLCATSELIFSTPANMETAKRKCCELFCMMCSLLPEIHGFCCYQTPPSLPICPGLAHGTRPHLVYLSVQGSHMVPDPT